MKLKLLSMKTALKNNFSIYLAIGISLLIGFIIAFMVINKGSSELVYECGSAYCQIE